MRGVEKYTVYQASSSRQATKDTLAAKGQAENVNTQTSAAGAVPALSLRRGAVRPRELVVRRKSSDALAEPETKKRPSQPEVIDMTTKESREQLQREVQDAMPQIPHSECGENPDIDIDIADEFDPSLLGAYVKEIFAYLTVVEKRLGYPLNEVDTSVQAKHVEFVTDSAAALRQTAPVAGSAEYGLNSYQRAKVIDFVSSIHLNLSLCNEALFLCVQLIDRVNFLEGALGKSDAGQRQQDRVRGVKRLIDTPYLLGLTCLVIANKYEDRYTPRLRDFVRCTGSKFTMAEVIECERRVLKLLDYALYCPTPIVFLRRYCRIDDMQTMERYLAFLVGEMCFRSPVLSSLRPSLLAAAILGFVNEMTGRPVWSERLAMYSNIREADIQPIVRNIRHFVKDYDRSFYASAKDKYTKKRYHVVWNEMVKKV